MPDSVWLPMLKRLLNTALEKTTKNADNLKLHHDTPVQITWLKSIHPGQCWHGKFYPLGKTGWVKLDKRVSFTH